MRPRVVLVTGVSRYLGGRIAAFAAGRPGDRAGRRRGHRPAQGGPRAHGVRPGWDIRKPSDRHGRPVDTGFHHERDRHPAGRDAIEDTIVIGGYSFRFIDTAGLRSSSETIESIGIERTWEKIHLAAVILYVFDVTSHSFEDVLKLLLNCRS